MKGLAVLEWLATQSQGVRVTDVAQAFGLAPSNAHRTLRTLMESGWVLQNPATSAYRASCKLFELGALFHEVTDLKLALHPVLEELARDTGETIHLAILVDADVLYLDKFDSSLPVAAYSRIGGRAPAYCVASGKALLAAGHFSHKALRARLHKLEAHTPHTVTEWHRLFQELDRAREQGWAQNKEEWRLGVCGLGAPVFDAWGEAVAAVGMSVPSIRFGRQHAKELAQRVCRCAEQASSVLGHRPPATTMRRQP